MSTAARTAPTTASLLVNIVDGTRKPIPSGVEVLVRVLDGNQNQVHADFHKSSDILFRDLPWFDNFGDNYTVIVSASGYLQTGFTPVRVSPRVLQSVGLMLLRRENAFNYRAARWAGLKAGYPDVFRLLSDGAENQAAARDRYTQLMETRPASTACFWNLMAALEDIVLPSGNPLKYLRRLVWDESFAQDRFFAWADRALIDQVKLAAAQGVFAPQVGSGFFHPGATSSFKQIQFGEANLQLTFHENTKPPVQGADWVLVEPDIDYFRDLGAHALLEVLPNTLTSGKTDPKLVYVLRWMAGKHAGVPEFDPPYTIEAA
jgi:hypothetical protein